MENTEKRYTAIVDDASPDIAGALVDQLIIDHPPPWRIERDWTHEVTASDGYIVAKCRTQDLAELIILYASKRAGEFEKIMDEIMRKDDIKVENP